MEFNKSNEVSDKARAQNLFVKLIAAVGSILSVGLAFAVGALVFFAWFADEVLEGGTRAFDDYIRAFVHGFSNETLTALMRFFTTLGSTLVVTILSVCIFTVFVVKNRKRAAALFAATMLGALALEVTLKWSFQRARPTPFFETILPASYSFPSGHALFALCFYGALAWLITARIKKRLWQILIWSLAVSLALLIGLSRVYLGVHYPSDVLAGYAAAIVWLLTIVLTDSWLENKRSSIKKQLSNE